MKRVLKYTTLLIVSALSACTLIERLDLKGLFFTDSGDADARFNQSISQEKQHPHEAHILSPTEDYKVYICSDTHIKGENPNVERFVNDYLADQQAADFILNLGDVIDAEAEDDYSSIKIMFGSLWDKMYISAGNHDIYFNQWNKFLTNCGGSAYTFEVELPSGKKDLYITFDSACGTLGALGMTWLKQELLEASAKNYRHIIAFTHTNFFKKDYRQGHASNYSTEETYELIDLFSQYGVDIVLSGHAHQKYETTLKGVKFCTCDALIRGHETAQYSIMNVTSDAISINFVACAEQ